MVACEMNFYLLEVLKNFESHITEANASNKMIFPKGPKIYNYKFIIIIIISRELINIFY